MTQPNLEDIDQLMGRPVGDKPAPTASAPSQAEGPAVAPGASQRKKKVALVAGAGALAFVALIAAVLLAPAVKKTKQSMESPGDPAELEKLLGASETPPKALGAASQPGPVAPSPAGAATQAAPLQPQAMPPAAASAAPVPAPAEQAATPPAGPAQAASASTAASPMPAAGAAAPAPASAPAPAPASGAVTPATPAPAPAPSDTSASLQAQLDAARAARAKAEREKAELARALASAGVFTVVEVLQDGVVLRDSKGQEVVVPRGGRVRASWGRLSREGQ